MSELAIFGGAPVRTKPFPRDNNIGEEEKRAVMAVLDSGVLSRYLGTWHPDFFGGPEVQAFEKEWAAVSGVKHGIAVNSCTSGLYAAVGAVGVKPGDEVIVSPYTMIASATAALVYQGVPVFADIDPDTYTISAETIAPLITKRTKAILVVHIFGQCADMDPIMALARKHGIKVIEDCAQSPLATYKGRPAGSLGDIGVFSLNYHKHIHTGEGGMCTTNDDELAERLQLIRNHAEAVVEGKGVKNLTNMLGFNYRLGELEAAIGRSQLKKAPSLIATRKENVRYLDGKLAGIAGLGLPKIGPAGDHVYYAHVLDYDEAVTGVSRELFVKAVKAELAPTESREHEGVLLGGGYVKPIYLTPIYRELKNADGSPAYRQGMCPNTEAAHYHRVIAHELMRPKMTKADLDDVAAAFHKVAGNLHKLSDHAASRSAASR